MFLSFKYFIFHLTNSLLSSPNADCIHLTTTEVSVFLILEFSSDALFVIFLPSSSIWLLNFLNIIIKFLLKRCLIGAGTWAFGFYSPWFFSPLLWFSCFSGLACFWFRTRLVTKTSQGMEGALDDVIPLQRAFPPAPVRWPGWQGGYNSLENEMSFSLYEAGGFQLPFPTWAWDPGLPPGSPGYPLSFQRWRCKTSLNSSNSQLLQCL